MKVGTILTLLVLAWIFPVCAADRPNVIVILSDDQGYPDLGCFGTKPIVTPNLDRLAAEGVRGTNFYVAWNACTPSRSSILTGRYPQRNGLYDMIRNDMVDYRHQYTQEEYAVSPEMTLGLDVREITIGNVLTGAGYVCGVVGKWDMGQAKRFLPLQRGFQFFYGHGNNGIDYYTHERYGIPSIFSGNSRTEEDKGLYITDVFEREALAFTRSNARHPFFLYLAFNAPHGASSFGPLSTKSDFNESVGVQAPEKYVAMYRGKFPNDKKDRIARYCGAVTCMDDAIGELRAALKEAGVEDNTLIFFLSDNGGAGNGGNDPLRGHKSTMWEGGLRVPFIAWWPGKIPAGKVTDEFLTSLELFPTLCQATGTPLPPGIKFDGFDLMPVLRGEIKSPRQEMYWQRRSDKAARVGNWKWIEAAAGNGLFDLSQDLGEKHDLTKEKPEIAAMMRAHFAAWRKEMDDSEPRGPFRDY